MKIRFVTNACMEIIAGDARILCDPWLVGRAFDGSWTQWPPLRLAPKDFTDYTHLYISHIHSDHCDPHTLRMLPNKQVSVILLKSPDGFLRKRIASCGFSNFIELGEGESAQLGNVRVTMHEAFAPNPFLDTDIPNIIDSSIVVEDGTHRFLNINDNTPDEASCKRLKERYGRFDGVTVPYSGVGPYPSSYINLTPESRLMHADRKQRQYLDRMLTVARILEAGVYFPLAGQMILCGRQTHKNQVLGVAQQSTAVDLLWKKGFPAAHLEEGDEFNLLTGELHKTLPQAPPVDYQELSSLRYAWEDAFQVPPDERVALVPLLQAARERLGKKQNQYGFFREWETAVRLEGEPEWSYVFSWAVADSPVRKIRTEELLSGKTKFLMVVVPYNYLIAILTRHCHWNNAYHGCQVEWLRQPDEYVPELQTLFSYFHL